MVTVRSGGPRFAEGGALTPLGMVVSEHIDKLALFEPKVRVVEKCVTEDAVSFTLDIAEGGPKSLDEIVRGYRIGCFRIAREYGLIAPDDPTPIFSQSEI